MNERWQRIEEIFTEAAALDADERESYLVARCGGDQELRAEIESLLRAAGDATTFFGDLARRAGLSGLDEDASGRRVGAYRLEYALGHGGMSAVYLAERADRQFEKRVAIKLVPFAVWGEEARQRFALERRILARLEHPNIARLLDGGVSEDGVPYLVMEYVEGKPLDIYCDEKRLGIEARLELFLTVCDAVAYAHRNLVIHRDLKPTNILVTEDGVVKLLDFGIAKLIGSQTEAGDGGEATLTRLGSHPLTPAYAGPELLRGEAVTTASDVYALGALLYKLLSGRVPYDLSESSEAEAIRRVCDTTPPLPSQAVAATEERSEADAKRLRRRLAGDLDTIAMKALRKEPERRYGSVEQLAEDLRRHLEHLPVRARPDTARYRLSRFVRRHRIGVAATAALVVLALASGAVIATYAVRVTRQKDQIARERDKSEQVAKFLAGIFENAHPNTTPGETITARELLDRGAARIEKELAGRPALQATMLDQIGMIYYNLSLYDEAKPLLEKALTLNRKQYGENSLQTVKSLQDLALTVEYMGDFEMAEGLYRRALAIAQRLKPGSDKRAVADVLNGLSRLALRQANYPEATEYLRRALAMNKELFGENSSQFAETLTNLAILNYRQGEYAASEALDRRALKIRKQLFGSVHPDVGVSLNDLALDLLGQGKFSEAEAILIKVLAMQKELYGSPQEGTALMLHNLAHALSGEGRLAEAIEKERAAIAMGHRLWEEPHPRLGLFYSYLGDLRTLHGDYNEAREALNKALKILTNTLPPDHYRVGIVHLNMGRLYASTGNCAKAVKQYHAALDIFREAYPHGNAKIWRTQSLLGDCLRVQKRYAEAEPLLTDGYRILHDKLGANHPRTQTALRRLVRFYEETGDAAKAAQYREILTAPPVEAGAVPSSDPQASAAL